MARSKLALPLLALGIVLLLACCADAGSSSSESSDSSDSSDSSESREHRSRKHSHVNTQHGHRLSDDEVAALLRAIVFKKPAVVTYDVGCNERHGACNEISQTLRR